MAELVNQRIEDMINEFEQMRRIDLYNDEEIREIARKRKEFEYKIQRRVKSKEDFVHYIAYELALLEDVSLRRKRINLQEKKNDIEYAISKRLNKIFKQFIYRFQNDVEVYFQYIKFCRSVGFDQAVSGIIGQMLQHYGDKPKMWQMASKWESEDQRNLQNARDFLLKGLHRHPEAEFLYLDLFKLELLISYSAESDEEKEKQLKRADVVWRNGVKNLNDVTFLFKAFDLSLKYDIAESISEDIKKEIWARNGQKEVWVFIAMKELEGCHWREVEKYAEDDNSYPESLKYFISTFEEALVRFHDEKVCTKYIQCVLGIDDRMASGVEKVEAVKRAWRYGHEQGLLSGDMYQFGIQLLKVENELCKEELIEILDSATKKNPSARYLWVEKLMLCKPDEKKMLSILQEAGHSKALKADDVLHLWNILIDNVETSVTLKSLYKRLQNCENVIIMAIKPKLLQRIYQHSGLKAARDMYEEFIRTPPMQAELHTVMIEIEKSQDAPNAKQIRKCYECCIQHHGGNDINIWTEYMKFETESGNAQLAPAIYRRAIGALNKELVDEFIKTQTLAKLNQL